MTGSSSNNADVSTHNANPSGNSPTTGSLMPPYTHTPSSSSAKSTVATMQPHARNNGNFTGTTHVPAPAPGPTPLHPSARYPYLHHADKKKARVYQSPYAPEGGFTPLWMPNPEPDHSSGGPHHHAKKHSRSSLSQEFLLQRTPSQRETVNRHVRAISTGKVANVLPSAMALQGAIAPGQQKQRQPTKYQTSMEFELQVKREAERQRQQQESAAAAVKNGYERFFKELRTARLQSGDAGNTGSLPRAGSVAAEVADGPGTGKPGPGGGA